jgi:hypothetical protein
LTGVRPVFEWGLAGVGPVFDRRLAGARQVEANGVFFVTAGEGGPPGADPVRPRARPRLTSLLPVFDQFVTHI